MRSDSDDRKAKNIVEPGLNKAGYQITSFRGIDDRDYWVHIQKESYQ